MPRAGVRLLIGIVAGYATNAILTWGTDAFLLRSSGADQRPSTYFILDVITQCAYTVAGGYVCAAIGQRAAVGATYGLMSLGVLIGLWSMVTSWATEPHWYAILLWAVWVPCISVGKTLRDAAAPRGSVPTYEGLESSADDRN